uniref:Secreted protein n=1 Tax=Parascaris univalens TaxID=6257 RepID=A0A915BDT4_PARUN
HMIVPFISTQLLPLGLSLRSRLPTVCAVRTYLSGSNRPDKKGRLPLSADANGCSPYRWKRFCNVEHYVSWSGERNIYILPSSSTFI